MAFADGTATATGSVDAGWGRDAWGSLAWGQNFVDATAEPTGLQSNVALQNPTIIAGGSVVVSPAEDQMDTLLGTLTMSGSAVVLPTGIGLRTGLPGNPNEYSAEGSTALSTDQAKFGVSSVEFDGTSGQGVQQNVSSGFASGDFTSEFWIYSSSIRSQSCTLWDFRISGIGLLLTNLNGQISFFKDGAGGSSPTSILTDDTWHHIAIVRSGSTGNVYVDGNLQITRTIGTDDYSSHTVLLGNNVFDSSGYLSGYIDEYRDSNIVRYSSNFTPPTSAFTVDDNTYSLLHFDGADGSTEIINSVASEQIDIIAGATVIPTGVEAPAETGTPIIAANANVDVTGNSINFTSGEVEVVASHIEEVTGQEIGTATGNVVIESAYTLTGELIQFTQGEEVIVANADVPVTGVEMSVVLGNMRSTPWANVVTGASNTWTEVAA
jgi:hypothetical protein